MSIPLLILFLATGSPEGPPQGGPPQDAVVVESEASQEDGTQAADPRLVEIRTLARAGAQDLALGLLEQGKPSFAIDPVRWRRWDNEHLFLLRSRGRWQAILDLTAQHPDGLDADARAWRQVQRTQASIALGDAGSAIDEIRGLLWRDATLTSDARRSLRRALIDAYQSDERLDAARIALQRHRQDYPDGASSLILPQARVYLLSGEPAAADGLLPADSPQEEIAALKTLAGLRSGALAPGDLLPELIARASQQDRAPDERRRDWLLAAETAARMGNLIAEVSAQERALALTRSGALPDPVFTLTADDLWRTYVRVGLIIGNRANLIQGDDISWAELARERSETDPVDTRVLLAFLARRGYDADLRAAAAWQLGAQLWLESWGPDAAYQLFLGSEEQPDPETLSPALRYRLVDLVLARGDVGLASRLMQDLTAPPADSDPVEWILRRSRILILGGRPEAALDGLALLVANPNSVNMDRLLQPMFDLQAAELHEDALPLLDGLMAWPMEPQQRRELLYWIAESRAATGALEEAARLYLNSATLNDPFAMDPWAQTARFQAADALADAGRVDDARALYNGLLGATQDPGRQALLRQKLQSLQLHDGHADEPSIP
jgi:TolA-binding protein